jgi:hypothetical protein
MAAKKKAPRRRKVTVEESIKGRKPQPDDEITGNPRRVLIEGRCMLPGEIDQPGTQARSDIVAAMKRQRQIPREATEDVLVPEHVREMYAHIWRVEHEALRREEALKEAYTWRGIRRRTWRRVVDAFAGRHRYTPAPTYRAAY